MRFCNFIHQIYFVISQGLVPLEIHTVCLRSRSYTSGSCNRLQVIRWIYGLQLIWMANLSTHFRGASGSQSLRLRYITLTSILLPKMPSQPREIVNRILDSPKIGTMQS